jgi:hypothetical protein
VCGQSSSSRRCWPATRLRFSRYANLLTLVILSPADKTHTEVVPEVISQFKKPQRLGWYAGSTEIFGPEMGSESG